jgi:hypothetical protein
MRQTVTKLSRNPCNLAELSPGLLTLRNTAQTADESQNVLIHDPESLSPTPKGLDEKLKESH